MAVQPATLLEKYDPADPMVLEVSVAIGMLLRALGRPLLVNRRRYLWDFGRRLYHLLQTIIISLKDIS